MEEMMRMSSFSGALLLACATLLGSGCALLQGDDGASAPRTPDATGAAGGTVVGIVRSVDPQARTLTLRAEPAAQLSLRNQDDATVAYDESTSVHYQGRTYRPDELEAGDRISATIERSGSRLVARRIDVLSDVSGDSGAAPATPSQFEARVRWVDTGNRTIELEPLSGDRGAVMAAYDEQTRVQFEGRDYRPEDLERGDIVRARTRVAGDRVVAEAIEVTGNVRSAGGQGDAAPGATLLRGTIREIDRSAQRIRLDAGAGAQSFDERAPADTPTSVAYDARTVVEYRGQRYGVGNLEPGDVVEIEAGRRGDDYLATRITVTRGV
jgi:hypothetical protein